MVVATFVPRLLLTPQCLSPPRPHLELVIELENRNIDLVSAYTRPKGSV